MHERVTPIKNFLRKKNSEKVLKDRQKMEKFDKWRKKNNFIYLKRRR